MKYLIRILLPAIALFAILPSCKSQYEALLNSNDVDAKYEAAFNFYSKAKYQKAANLFESLSVLTNGTERDDTVQYYWGLSNYKFKDYYTAETNFSKFVESYPRSPFAPEARFLRIDCLYRQTLRYELDQNPTRVAIISISEYLQEYPKSTHREACTDMLADLNNRLDTKAYEGAKLYYKMEDYQASRVALRNVIKDNSENVYREDILYLIAMSSYKYAHLSVPAKQHDRYLTFADDYLNFISELPDSKYRKELDALYTKSQRALGKHSASDEKDVKEKVYAKERKLMEKSKKSETQK